MKAVLVLAALFTTSATISLASQQSFPAFNQPPPSLLEEVLSPPPSLNANGQICRPTGQIHDACCDYETVEKSLNTPRFFQTLGDLVKTNYFRYYKVDLYKDCPFWTDNGGLCMNRACTVEKASEDEIPEAYRSQRLSSVDPADEGEIIFHSDHSQPIAKPTASFAAAASPQATGGGAKDANTCQCRETDFCHWEQEETSSESTWVDLLKNPERFTGYAGPGANRVWRAIYEENCFGAVPKGSFIEPPRAKESGGGSGFVNKNQLLGSSSSSSPFGGSNPLMGGGGLNKLIPSLQAPADPAANEQCLEKRVFYRVISGLHASISTHICSEYLDQKTGEWSPNLECFVSRIAQHPERLQNVYFNYVLLVRALARAGEQLTSFRLKRGDGIPASEQKTLLLLESLVSQANECPPTFDEASMFHPSNPEAPQLKRQFRDHFRNISAIMDCVGCDKCRLWGKMQVNGLGTAMKILFSFEDEEKGNLKAGKQVTSAPLLERSELVALINTLHRFAESLKAVETFREMYQSQLKDRKRKDEENKQRREQQSKNKPASAKEKDTKSEGRGAGNGSQSHQEQPVSPARPASTLKSPRLAAALPEDSKTARLQQEVHASLRVTLDIVQSAFSQGLQWLRGLVALPSRSRKPPIQQQEQRRTSTRKGEL